MKFIQSRGSNTFGLLLVSAWGVLVLGCTPERSVQLEQLSKTREGQIVDDDYIRLLEGHAIGVAVEAFKNDILKEGWSIEATSSKRSVLRVDRTKEEKTFVLSGASAGEVELRFLLQGKHQVTIDVEVVSRPSWRAGGDGGQVLSLEDLALGAGGAGPGGK